MWRNVVWFGVGRVEAGMWLCRLVGRCRSVSWRWDQTVGRGLQMVVWAWEWMASGAWERGPLPGGPGGLRARRQGVEAGREAGAGLAAHHPAGAQSVAL